MAQLNPSQIANHAGRNLIINGDFRVLQRSGPFTALGNADSQYTLDRWKFIETGSVTGELTFEQSTSHPYSNGKSFKVTTATAQASLATGDQFRVRYAFEGQEVVHLLHGTSAAKTITLSFWAMSNRTGTFGVSLWKSTSNRYYTTTITINQADTWEYKTITIPGDTSGAITNDTNEGLQLTFDYGSGTTYQASTTEEWASGWYPGVAGAVSILDNVGDYLSLAEVQLEVGSSATEFEHLKYSEQLARCQRYYNVTTFWSLRGFSTFRCGNSGTQMLGQAIPYSVPMRVAPTPKNLSTTSVVSYVKSDSQALTQGGTAALEAQCLSDRWHPQEDIAGTNGHVYIGWCNGNLIMEFDADL